MSLWPIQKEVDENSIDVTVFVSLQNGEEVYLLTIPSNLHRKCDKIKLDFQPQQSSETHLIKDPQSFQNYQLKVLKLRNRDTIPGEMAISYTQNFCPSFSGIWSFQTMSVSIILLIPPQTRLQSNILGHFLRLQLDHFVHQKYVLVSSVLLSLFIFQKDENHNE